MVSLCFPTLTDHIIDSLSSHFLSGLLFGVYATDMQKGSQSGLSVALGRENQPTGRTKAMFRMLNLDVMVVYRYIYIYICIHIPVFVLTEPVFGSFSRMVIFCWPVAVFGRMQPVFVQQIVDKKP